MYQAQYRFATKNKWFILDTKDSLEETLELVRDSMTDDFMCGDSGDYVYRIVKV